MVSPLVEAAGVGVVVEAGRRTSEQKKAKEPKKQNKNNSISYHYHVCGYYYKRKLKTIATIC